MGETVFEQITKSPEVLAKFLKPYIDETILYDMYCEKICTKSEECAKRGCIIDDTDTEYMLKNLFLSDHETFMSDGKNKKINTILDGYKPEESSKQITEKICSESANSKRERDTYRIRTGDVLMSEVKRNWSRDAKTVFFNIFSANGMCTDEISKGIFFENETSKKIFLQSLATNSLRITDFTDCFESSAVADIKLAGAKEEIMTALEPYYIIFKQFQYMYAQENIRNGVLECNA